MTRDSGHFEQLQGRIRGLLINVSDQLSPFTVGLVDELVDANECGIAVEMLSDMLIESDAALDSNTFADVEHLVKEMGLDPGYAERLRPMVADRPFAEDE
jgi:hypothetical protein